MKRFMLAFVVLAALLAPSARADDGGRKQDIVWARAGLDTMHLGRIAMLPAASFDRDLSHEKLAEGMLAVALRGSGHRWMSSTASRTLLRTLGGDSLLDGVREELLKNARLDSTTAIRVCALLHTNALLAIRVDRFEQVKLEIGQSGKPYTTVHARAALMDDTGRLLWTISGSETGEGPYQTPASNPYRTPAGGVNMTPTNTNVGPPSFEEVMQKLFARWGTSFPHAQAAK